MRLFELGFHKLPRLDDLADSLKAQPGVLQVVFTPQKGVRTKHD